MDTTSGPQTTADNDVAVFAPTPLLTVAIEKEADDEPRMHLHVGGQGAWIARMVRTLGATPRYCAAFGGETGQVARMLCEWEGFDVRAVETAGWNGAYVHDRRSGERVELADAPATPLSRHELDDLYSTTLSAALSSAACIIAGAHADGVVPDEVFARLGVARARRLPDEDALRLAAAAATATVTRHGLGTGRRELIEATVPRVEVVALD